MEAEPSVHRGGPQLIPRPPDWRIGRPAPWAHLDSPARRIDVARLREAFSRPGSPVVSEAENAGGRATAVLAPFYEEDGRLHLVLTRRAWHLRRHSGEVSFPGGGREGDETPVQTALREAEEEIALDPSKVEIIGELDHLSTVRGDAYIVPYVGLLGAPPADLQRHPGEVEAILHVPVDELLLDEVFREESWGIFGAERPIFFFELVGDTVWGATAAMLRLLLARVLGLEGVELDHAPRRVR